MSVESSALHEGRARLLAGLQLEDRVVVSVGASGTWYFDWIHDLAGSPREHIGVEYYSPRPDDLPPNVQWVANTAGAMNDVDSDVADVVFSGQNLEHLWREDVEGFVQEAHRILKPGGLLVIDSPNRLITVDYGDAHPEHIVEMTPAEARALFTAAGFDVESVRGVMLCRDVETQELLPKLGADNPEGWSTERRLSEAGGHPDESYIWWLEARKSDRASDLPEIEAVLDAFWSTAWAERMARFVSEVGVVLDEGGISVARSQSGEQGILLFGPYAPVRAGHYEAVLRVRRDTPLNPGERVGFMDVMVAGSTAQIAHVPLEASMLPVGRFVDVSAAFGVAQTAFGFQARIFTNGISGLSVERRVELRPVAGPTTALAPPADHNVKAQSTDTSAWRRLKKRVARLRRRYFPAKI